LYVLFLSFLLSFFFSHARCSRFQFWRCFVYNIKHKESVFWGIILSSPLETSQCLGGTCHLSFWSRSMSQGRDQHEASRLCFLPSPRRPNHGGITIMSGAEQMPLSADELIFTCCYRVPSTSLFHKT
jgi:hypothetical protein